MIIIKTKKQEVILIDIKNTKDNIYIKLAKIRVDLQNMNIKKSGKNNFAHYSYFELYDFLPLINKLSLQYKVVNVITFSDQEATLSVINIDNPEEFIDFKIKTSYVNMKGSNELQNLGASYTYLRRYLYFIAYEICETDAIDSSDPSTISTHAPSNLVCSVCQKPISSDMYKKSIEKYGIPLCSSTCKNSLAVTS